MQFKRSLKIFKVDMLKNDFGQPGDGTLKFKVFEEWIDEIYIYIYIYIFFLQFLIKIQKQPKD